LLSVEYVVDWLKPVWFGVVYCMNMHVAYLSPPFAPSAFYTKSITPPEITMTQIYKATMPYLYWTLLATAIVTAWIGVNTFVATIVAIEFAESWKPLTKSNAQVRRIATNAISGSARKSVIFASHRPLN
jgi:hypothetical protein